MDGQDAQDGVSYPVYPCGLTDLLTSNGVDLRLKLAGNRKFSVGSWQLAGSRKSQVGSGQLAVDSESQVSGYGFGCFLKSCDN
jgi:hypothetical protein